MVTMGLTAGWGAFGTPGQKKNGKLKEEINLHNIYHLHAMNSSILVIQHDQDTIVLY